MIRYSKEECRGKKDYVPSEYYEPEYRCLSDDSLEYYLYWRQCAREGKYGTTDEGYLWLYECELINAYDDVEYVLDQLSGLSRAYDRYLEYG